LGGLNSVLFAFSEFVKATTLFFCCCYP